MSFSSSIHFRRSGLLLLAVFLFSLVGIYWRPLDQFSTLWPANAVLLGIFLRVPGLASPMGWAAAAVAYIAADMLTGSSWKIAILLNLTNLLSVLVALTVCRQATQFKYDLASPTSLPRLFLAIVAAALMAGLLGGMLIWQLFDSPMWPSVMNWVVAELLSYIVILPSVLTIPDWRAWRWRERRAGAARPVSQHVIPAMCLIAALLASVFIGGPGVVAFPVIALLACALSCGLFLTSLLTLVFSVWTLLGTAFGNIQLVFDVNDLNNLLSMRLGVASVAVAPIVVACVMAARESSLIAMRHLAEHDALTGLLNRRTFHLRARERLAQLAQQRKPAAVLMLDIDHFKSINDRYGHAAGDDVLAMVTTKLGQSLRSSDLCGRVGGEEFTVLIPECTQELLDDIALRIHQAVSSDSYQAAEAQALRVTLSIGATLGKHPDEDLESMLLRADQALYAAKNAGRNQTQVL